VSLSEAIAKRLKINWSDYQPVPPAIKEKAVVPYIPVAEVAPYIDWKFFFHSWNLSARYASVQYVDACPSCRAGWLETFPENEREKASEAARLFTDTQSLLEKLTYDKAECIKAVFGIFEAYSEDECIYINGVRFPMLRRQTKNDKDEYLSLCDFVAPEDSGKKDYAGAFTVTANAVRLLEEYETRGDEYRLLLLKSLLDRLAEATAEYLHAKIRKEYWGFAAGENLSVQEMFVLKYQGIRPAVGYPSIPDQSINFLLNNDLLRSDEIGVTLSENGVMLPNASVSGIIIAHPRAKYFAVGRISEEQAAYYARHRSADLKTIRKFLAGNLE
jgi:5-methyltetrahydrofolate--homocysteine methyltransferase